LPKPNQPTPPLPLKGEPLIGVFRPQIVARVLQPQGVTIAVVNIAESMSLAQSVGKLTVIPLNKAKN